MTLCTAFVNEEGRPVIVWMDGKVRRSTMYLPPGAQPYKEKE